MDPLKKVTHNGKDYTLVEIPSLSFNDPSKSENWILNCIALSKTTPRGTEFKSIVKITNPDSYKYAVKGGTPFKNRFNLLTELDTNYYLYEIANIIGGKRKSKRKTYRRKIAARKSRRNKRI